MVPQIREEEEEEEEEEESLGGKEVGFIDRKREREREREKFYSLDAVSCGVFRILIIIYYHRILSQCTIITRTHTHTHTHTHRFLALWLYSGRSLYTIILHLPLYCHRARNLSSGNKEILEFLHSHSTINSRISLFCTVTEQETWAMWNFFIHIQRYDVISPFICIQR